MYIMKLGSAGVTVPTIAIDTMIIFQCPFFRPTSGTGLNNRWLPAILHRALNTVSQTMQDILKSS